MDKVIIGIVAFFGVDFLVIGVGSLAYGYYKKKKQKKEKENGIQ